MNVVILHYHFDSGGVFQVAWGHICGLAALPSELRPRRLVLMHGGRAEGMRRALTRQAPRGLEVECAVVPELEYDDRRATPGGAAPLRRALTDRLRELGLDRGETVLHAHNATLGRHVGLPPTITAMAAEGWHWLLQIHDFAEDLRPQNLLALVRAAGAADPASLQRWLYPRSPRVHYATLVQRDATWLVRSGIDPRHCGVVPNPILPSDEPEPIDRDEARRQIDQATGGRLPADHRYVLYPVRGIRRKNLGEVLLWAMLCPRRAVFSLTLPPTTSLERSSWERWRRWAEELRLPLLFGSGTLPGITLDLNRAACDAVLTTSVAEGFGMAFLEPWLANRPVVGRDLTNATADFRAAGIEFDGLYPQFPIPVTPADRERYCRRREAARRRSAAALPHAFSDWLFELHGQRDEVSRAEAAEPGIDFASLLVSDQLRLLSRLRRDEGFRDTCREMAAEVLGLLTETRLAAPAVRERVATNRQRVAETYAPQVIAERLLHQYHRLLDRSGAEPATPASVAATAEREAEVGAASPSILEIIAGEQTFYPLRTELIVQERTFERLRQRLQPQPTGELPQLRKLDDIRAVIFDIYGTLVISGSGDVGSADRSPREQALLAACRAVGVELGEESVEAALGRLHAIIAAHQQAHRVTGIEHPEVDIVDVWCAWLSDTAGEDGAPAAEAQRRALRERAALLAREFEARANPCDAMPGGRELLGGLAERGLLLGVVSNAQVFTPDVVATALETPWATLGFDRDLTFFSYRFAEAKPGTGLFDRLVSSLRRRDVAPQQAIYIGNDMLNDVMAARRAGLRTVLFAGDRRSLRWRTGDSRIDGVQPDVVISELRQLLEAISL